MSSTGPGVDRTDPMMREAMDTAARVAEHLLGARNSDAARELALDVINDYVGGLYDLIHGRHLKRLAWALTLTERRNDLKPHEQRLLDAAWQRVREDQAQREWERMGDG